MSDHRYAAYTHVTRLLSYVSHGKNLHSPSSIFTFCGFLRCLLSLHVPERLQHGCVLWGLGFRVKRSFGMRLASGRALDFSLRFGSPSSLLLSFMGERFPKL